jgi:hypothetical protein
VLLESRTKSSIRSAFMRAGRFLLSCCLPSLHRVQQLGREERERESGGGVVTSVVIRAICEKERGNGQADDGS